ncbi:glycoside hydrolase family 88 protein [Paenibacillus contaminans]|uniref:Glucuronyl hydrolase n=1 Tax=Paenibacillus contaminans TaxID=450362 RepID=A0A329MJ22_9BACL|nr:glycoside hydrolase family 88 protein [Paenibacillus contaminans]RAV19971.1 glucuronyl hydrolase [Paenibacillus contaminans]
MWKKAIEDAVVKTRKNIERYGEQFPHVALNGGGYTTNLNPNTDWTDGFWTGMLWLCYEYSKDETFREAAQRNIESFRKRLADNIALEHHDIGFLYSLSAKAGWIIEKDEAAKELTLKAADKLLGRWREEAQLIQAWGPLGDEKQGGRIIIDCLMNLPLLYWASEMTGENRYREVAVKHAEKSRRYLVRGDDSSYHTFYFEQDTGIPIGGSTHQGYQNGSTWTRGQAWGIYGFALSYKYTKNPAFLETSRRLARYFLENLPEDDVAYWDFDVPADADTYRDSSASAIVCAGLLELLDHLDANDAERPYFEGWLKRSLQSLVQNYSTIGEEEAEGLIKRGSYHVRGNSSPDDFVIWGDYYYLEALMRIEKGVTGYWYNR